MDMIDAYLATVRLYLPKQGRDDIAAELADDIRSQIREQEQRLGRALHESEFEGILSALGDPMAFASRFRKRQRSLTLGRTLIGPELFPFYVALLVFNALVTGGWFVYAIVQKAVDIPMMMLSLVIQFVCVTFAVTLIDYVRRKFPREWFFPPSAMVPLIPIAKWKSVLGLVLWLVFGLWWVLLPRFPSLLFGSAANLRLTSGFLDFTTPVLFFLVLGMLQRIVNLARPLWTWLPPMTRVVANVGGLVICYLMIKAYPYVAVVDPSIDPGHYSQLAGVYNASILFGFLVTWLWIFFGLSAIANAWVLVQHIRRRFAATSS